MPRFLAALVLVALALTGCGSPPADCTSGLSASETSLEFGSVFLNENSVQTLTLSLDCAETVTPLSIKDGTVPDNFVIDLGSPTMNPGEQRKVTVTFTPTTLGEFAGDVTIEAAATATKTLVVHVHGIGKRGSIDTDPHELDFGVVRIGNSKTLRMVVQNLIDSPQHLGISSDDPGFTIEPDTVDLVGLGAATIQVTFRPASRGSIDGPHLHFTLCATCEEVRRTVKGVGAIEDFTLTPSPLDFGTRSIGSNTCQDVTIRNTGDVPIMFAATTPDPYFTQSGIFDLQIGNLLDGSTYLDVKATVTVTVCFTPKALAKDYNGNVGFNTVDDEFQSLPVHGHGGGAAIVCTPDPLDFGVTSPDAGVTIVVKCTNLGEPLDVLMQGLTDDQPQTIQLDTSIDGDPMGFNVGRADYHFGATFSAAVPGQYASTIRLPFREPGASEDSELQLPTSCSVFVR